MQYLYYLAKIQNYLQTTITYADKLPYIYDYLHINERCFIFTQKDEIWSLKQYKSRFSGHTPI